jgi:hypothetical protein
MSSSTRPQTRRATAMASAGRADNTMKETTRGGGRRGRWYRSRPRRTSSLIVAAGLVLLVAACGGSPSSSRSQSSAGTRGSLSAYVSQQLAFARCVRAHGIPNYPDPDSGGHFPKQAMRQLGVSDSRLRAVQDSCQNLLPAGQAPLTAQDQQDYLRAAACMRSHGITGFPDPSFSGGSVTFRIPSSVDASSARFTQARQTCARLIPAGLPYSGS